MFSNLQIIRSSRKTIQIRIKDGSIFLNVPHKLPQREIQRILSEKNSWIQKKLQQDANILRAEPKKFTPGELFYFLGEPYPLIFIETKSKQIQLQGSGLQVPAPNIACPQVRRQYLHKKICNWYRSYAEKVLREKTCYYAEQLELKYKSIAIKQYKSRWGSCNSKGEIQYNWQLILAPEWIVDYVVVHEVSHLKHLNHSSQFWQCVGSVMPNYLECRKWLRQHGAALRID